MCNILQELLHLVMAFITVYFSWICILIGLMQLHHLNTYATTLCFGLLNPLGPIWSKMVFIKMARKWKKVMHLHLTFHHLIHLKMAIFLDTVPRALFWKAHHELGIFKNFKPTRNNFIILQNCECLKNIMQDARLCAFIMCIFDNYNST